MNESTPAVEQWRPVPGYEGLYEVSDLGRVRSQRRRGSAGRIKKLYMDPKDGYGCLVLYQNDQPQRTRVHVLVAAAFIGPRPEGLFVCHKDGDPANNTLSNLYYGTQTDNMFDAVRHGRHRQVRKTHCPRGHAYTLQNTRFWGPGNRHRKCRACEGERRRLARDRRISAG